VAPAPDVVVVLLCGVVVVVLVEGVVAPDDWRVVVGVVPLGDVVLVGVVVVVAVVVVVVVLVPLPPPKKVCPEPDWPRTTAEIGLCAISSMTVSDTMAITSTATMAPTMGRRMLRQFRCCGRRADRAP
jgi:hypothetical protein